jgi:DNA-binding MarR family transcriptional regulator
MSTAARALQQALAKMALNPGDCVYRSVARTARAVTVAFDKALAPHALSAGQFTIMLTLQRKGPLTVGQLARELAMDGSTVPRVLRALGDRGYLAFRAGADRRQKLVGITSRGQSALRPALAAWQQAQRRVLKASAVSNWPTVRRALADLREASLGSVAA